MLRIFISASVLHGASSQDKARFGNFLYLHFTAKVIVQLLLRTLHVLDDGIFAIFVAIAFLSGLVPFRRVIRATVCDSGVVENIFHACRSLPFIRQVVQNSKKKILCELDKSMKGTSISVNKILKLPNVGLQETEILDEATLRQQKDYADPFLSSRMTGTIYATDSAHRKVCNDIYSSFAHTNPLHSDAFPSVARMESEIINMAAAFLGGIDHHKICGTVTSGGTESILTALRASRDFVCYLKDIDQPEM